MPQKKRILIVRTNRDDLLKFKEEKIAELKNKKETFSYSDFAIDSDSALYILKVVPVAPFARAIFDELRGCPDIDADCILTELEKLVAEVRNICSKGKEATISPILVAQNEPRNAVKVGDDQDITNNLKTKE